MAQTNTKIGVLTAKVVEKKKKNLLSPYRFIVSCPPHTLNQI